MGVLISANNFKGKYAIAQPPGTSVLQAFIDDTEEAYLVDLFGSLMYAEFKSTLVPSPPASATVVPVPTGDAGYTAIYNPFYVDYGSKVYKSKGLVAMLQGFIYFEFMKQVGFKSTELGVMENNPDTGKRAVTANLYGFLNDATETYLSIQEYINNIHPELFNLTKLTPFNGQDKEKGITTLG